jgi:hypothetical protein
MVARRGGKAMTDKNKGNAAAEPTAGEDLTAGRDSFSGIVVTLGEADICRDQDSIKKNADYIRAKLRAEQAS